ncbi:MAG: hypothetical protein Q8R40_00475 [bacterium]|nr:hypothetical protein [bacterium]
MEGLYTGNALADKERDGWFVGHVMPETDLRYSREIAISYRSLAAGSAQKEMSPPNYATTFLLVTAGRLRNEYLFPDASSATITCSANEYALIMPGSRHAWEAEENCQVLCIQWPSVPDICVSDPPFTGHRYGMWRIPEGDTIRRDPWLLAHFMRPGDLRRVKEVDVDYGLFSRGNIRQHWISRKSTALMILVRGNVAMQFIENETIEKVALTRPGDYILSRPLQLHQNTWQIKQDTVVLTILWPSLPQQISMPKKK